MFDKLLKTIESVTEAVVAPVNIVTNVAKIAVKPIEKVTENIADAVEEMCDDD